MDSTPSKPRHPSYLMHRSQVAWQIILPMVLAGLVLIGLIVLISWATFRANGDVGRWAAISTMWLTIPVMIGGLVALAVLIAAAYLLGKVMGFIPRYTLIGQNYAAEMVAAAKKVEMVGHRPLMVFPMVGSLIRKALHRIRKR